MALPALINGIRYDVSSFQVKFNGQPLPSTGVKSLTYSDGLEPGEIYGNSPQKIGRTRGKYTAEASFELWLDESVYFEENVFGVGTNVGIGEVAFNLAVQISEAGRPAISDEIIGCRIKKRDMEMPGSGGSDGASVKYELDVMYVTRNGRTMIANLRRA